MTGAQMESGKPHPIRLVANYEPRRSRLTVFFRFLLAIPHILWFLLWSTFAAMLAVLNWLATLFAGRSPKSLHDFLASYVRYSVHLNAYLFLGANPFPGFAGDRGYPLDVEIDPPAPQNRWKTGFRIVLGLPCLLLAAVIAGGGFSVGSGVGYFTLGLLAFAGVLGWFASVVLGRMPPGLEHVVAYGTAYSAQVWGYLLLLTDRYPDSDPGLVPAPAPAPPRPIRLVVTDDCRRSRLTVAFRVLLALPHIVWLALWGIVSVVVVFLNWVVALFAGRSLTAFHRFLAALLRYQLQVSAYLFLVANPFPGFVPSDERPYPVDLTVDPPERQNRLVTLFRLPLALPAVILGGAFGGALAVAAMLGWFAALFTGRMPAGMRNLGAVALRYSTQYYGYILVVTDRYPYSGVTPDPFPSPEVTEPALPGVGAA